MRSFKGFITESDEHGGYKLGDKVVYNGETHVVVKHIEDGKVWVRKARRDSYRANNAKIAHHSELKPYVPPPKRDTSQDGTCQICGKQHKITNGVIAHHGYQRPGDGQQTASCDGARQKPFEVSRDHLATHIKDIHSSIEHHKKEAAELPNRTDTLYKNVRLGGFGHNAKHELREYPHGHERYEDVKKEKIQGHNNQVKLLTDYVEYQQKRHDGWKPKDKD
jgi:hypothetical protein